MSDFAKDVDLGSLARPAPAPITPRRRGVLRIVVPLAILAAFAAVLFSSLGDALRGAIDVTVVRPKAADSAFAAGAGAPRTVAFQAAGWIEPDPFPIYAVALTAGVVREVLVQESDVVRAGDPVARLIDDDAKLKLASADATLARAEAERAKAEAEAAIAKESFDAALAVTEAAASAKADSDGKDARAKDQSAAVAQGEARLRVSEEELAVQRELAKEGAAGPRQVELAEAKVAEARGMLAGLRAAADAAQADTGVAKAKLARADAEKTLRLEDRLRVRTSEAAHKLADAAVREAEAARGEAALRLDRMTVRAPADGVVMERLTAPGMIHTVGDAGGTPICSLYDVKKLRLRADVPQGEIAKVRVGGQVEILSEARPGRPYAGEVIRTVHKADIQKVTLQVHVRVLDGDALLRPEMLCQAKFFAAQAPADSRAGAADGGISEAVLAPARLVENGFVWVVDGATRTASRRKVEVGGRSGDWVEIRSGLNLSDKLIDGGRERLVEGARVRVGGG